VPWIARADVLDALESLDDHDVAVGPATDGGYYLLSLKRPEPELLRASPEQPSPGRDARRAARLGRGVRVCGRSETWTRGDLAADWGASRHPAWTAASGAGPGLGGGAAG